MKLDEIRGMSDADLRARVTELEEERFRLRFRGATETLEDPLRQRTVRRDIARVLTVLRQREQEAAQPAASARASKGASKGASKSAAKGAKSAKSSPKASGQTTRRGQTTAKPAAKAAR
jgi:large subunit ribosomal protein L29